MKRLPWLVLVVAMVAIGLFVPPAAAQGGLDGAGDHNEHDIEGEQTLVLTFTAVVESSRGHVSVEARPCAEWHFEPIVDENEVQLVDPETGELMFEDGVCVTEYHCGAERIDDIYSGAISGASAGGAYREYLGGVVENIIVLIELITGGLVTIDPTDEVVSSVSDALVEGGLGEPSSTDFIPVFSFCRIGEDGEIETVDDTYDPEFTWTATVLTEYDIITRTDVVVDRLVERIRGHLPEMRAIPPLGQGRTFVKFPMWLWIDEPVEFEAVYGISDLETVRIRARATLDRVEWSWGGEPLPCELEDMRAWIQGSDPTENVPDCHVVFDRLQSFELTASAIYRLEQQITYRPSRSVAWAEPPWEPAGPGEIPVTASAGVIDVRELLSLNVNEELDLG